MIKLDPKIPYDLSQSKVQPLPRVADNRGYLYLIHDTKFPEHIKFGTTVDVKRRLQDYNNHKPYQTAFVWALSPLLHNATAAETWVKSEMATRVEGKVAKQEWYDFKNIRDIIDLVDRAYETWGFESDHESDI